MGNNRILASSFLNRCCAPDSYLESMLLTRASKNVYRQHRSFCDIDAALAEVGFMPDCVAKRFCAPKPATLIQDQAATRNIDSKRCSFRFDYCHIAAPRRVLQHNLIADVTRSQLTSALCHKRTCWVSVSEAVSAFAKKRFAQRSKREPLSPECPATT